MNKPQITEPDTGDSNEPDSYTNKSPDWTDDKAPERVFFINLGFFRLGTKDKAFGASVLLSLALLVTIAGVIGVGLYTGPSAWLDRVFTWLGAAFLFIAGSAVGRQAERSTEKSDD